MTLTINVGIVLYYVIIDLCNLAMVFYFMSSRSTFSKKCNFNTILRLRQIIIHLLSYLKARTIDDEQLIGLLGDGEKGANSPPK